jgi:probable rRNA maturation factor
MTVHIDIEYATQCENCPNGKDIKSWALTVLQEHRPSCSLTIKIVDEEEMILLNRTYRKKEKSTNVLSFACQLPQYLKGDILGDIAICAPVVQREAIHQNKSLISHWAHLVVHGVLHLLGYDHEKESDAIVMEDLESTLLKELGFPDPYGAEKNHE